MDWKKLIPFGRRNRGGKSLIDREYIEESLEASPVPVVMVIILLWAVSSVLLLLSENRQRDLTVWQGNQRAPFSVWARTNFSYEDTTATEALRDQARAGEPLFFKVDEKICEGLRSALRNYFDNDFNSKYGVSLQTDHDQLLKDIDVILYHGIFSDSDFAGLPEDKPVRIITPNETFYAVAHDARSSAENLIDLLNLPNLPPHIAESAVNDIQTLLTGGNLIFDQKATDAAAEAAAANVPPVIKERKRGELLIERHQAITREVVDMFEAEKAALPSGYGLVLLGNQLILSCLLLMLALFFLYRVYPKIFKTPRRFATGGFAIILGLLANFGAFQLFFYFFRHGIVSNYELMLFMIPIPFGAALLTALLGNRTTIFAGFLVASISALMILPDRSFELAIRWFAIAALTALITRNLNNYRSFFIRTFFCGALLTTIINIDILYSFYNRPEILKFILITVLANSFICAMTALLAVFAFELIFNTDTSMSLMVLSDYNHPLLEKLKREAPGTMFHSMTVATLAEDAARAIKANPIRAKAGALFHDIGKLSMPQYFVENNVDSPKEHMKMPPQRSCGIIRGHVKEGLNLAREYRLCSFVREAIVTHHGDDLISFFYRRALENSNGDNLPVIEAQFRYDGEPPVNKELTIISLADACEAASRSLNKPTPAKLETLVNDIFIGRLRGGQLRNSELTTNELDIVRECFIADLISFHHGRIAYQKENSDDPTALPLEEQSASGSEKK